MLGLSGGVMKFWIPWGIAAAVTGTAVFYFLAGLTNGSVSSFNAGLWMLILLGTVGITASSLILKRSGRPGLGSLLALVLALPGLLAVLVLLASVLPSQLAASLPAQLAASLPLIQVWMM